MQAELKPAAEKFIRRMLRMSGSASSAFRLRVRLGGCSGPSAEFDIEPAESAADVTWTPQGITIHLDQESATLLEGATVDFADTRISSGFAITLAAGNGACCSSGSSASQLVSLG